MVEVRAKSTIKITTGKSNIDHTYQKGTPILDVTNDMIHGLIFSVGTKKARELINEKLSKYKDDYLGMSSTQKER